MTREELRQRIPEAILARDRAYAKDLGIPGAETMTQEELDKAIPPARLEHDRAFAKDLGIEGAETMTRRSLTRPSRRHDSKTPAKWLKTSASTAGRR